MSSGDLSDAEMLNLAARIGTVEKEETQKTVVTQINRRGIAIIVILLSPWLYYEYEKRVCSYVCNLMDNNLVSRFDAANVSGVPYKGYMLAMSLWSNLRGLWSAFFFSDGRALFPYMIQYYNNSTQTTVGGTAAKDVMANQQNAKKVIDVMYVGAVNVKLNDSVFRAVCELGFPAGSGLGFPADTCKPPDDATAGQCAKGVASGALSGLGMGVALSLFVPFFPFNLLAGAAYTAYSALSGGKSAGCKDLKNQGWIQNLP